ncbi:C-X-C motif chemokine 10-like [Odontesthes bonariensis]|uniref:C-X-C motif chemokine 10-like n=1 Tax=Odontesthes bonariensis TaxID=219752 RepID=UPI003F582313
MSSIIKLFLLLAVVVCISAAQHGEAGQQCLCQRVRNRMILRSEIKDVQIYQATVFCDRVEIVITNKNGLRYCLNPELKAVKKILTEMMKKPKTSTTFSPSTQSHTITTGI